MVATLSNVERFAPPPVGLGDPGRLRGVRFMWDEVLELIRLGMVPEDSSVELLDGVIVPVERGTNGKESEVPGRRHSIVTERLSNLRSAIDRSACHVETQQSLWCSPTYVPIPDFMVIRGRLDDYPDAVPRARDAFCVIEVADTSLRRDKITKLAAYARAGVPQYGIINLPERNAEVYTNPDVVAGSYPLPTVVAIDGTLSLRIGEDGATLDLPLAQLMS